MGVSFFCTDHTQTPISYFKVIIKKYDACLDISVNTTIQGSKKMFHHSIPRHKLYNRDYVIFLRNEPERQCNHYEQYKTIFYSSLIQLRKNAKIRAIGISFSCTTLSMVYYEVFGKFLLRPSFV